MTRPVDAPVPAWWRYLLPLLAIAFCALMISFLFVRPVIRMIRTFGYQETECVIESAMVNATVDSDGERSEFVDVRYTYSVDGQRYRSSRYDLWNNQNLDPAAIADSLRRDPTVTCFYDPDDPSQAVIDRSFHPLSAFTLIAVAGVLLGAASIRNTWRRRHPRGRDRKRRRLLVADRPRRSLGLRSIGPALAVRLAIYGFLGPVLLAISLFDGGGAIGALLAGEVSFLPGIWIVILLLFTAAMTAFFLHTLMRALGPRFALVTLQPARRGAPMTLQWRARGITPTIRSLSIVLVGREEAEFANKNQDGEIDEGAEEYEFFTRSLVADPPGERRRLSHGSVAVELPPFAFSFDSGHNRIRWIVRVAADVAAWADVAEELELEIEP